MSKHYSTLPDIVKQHQTVQFYRRQIRFMVERHVTPAAIESMESRVLKAALKMRRMLSATINAELQEAQEALERIDEVCKEGAKFQEGRDEAEVEEGDEDKDKEWKDGVMEARAVLRDVLGMGGRIEEYLEGNVGDEAGRRE